MQDKLQELTDRLYSEGLNKGKAEAQALVSKAGAEAQAIISEAKASAEAILAKARKDAADIAQKANADLKMAAAQTLGATKKDIENLIVGKITDQGVKAPLQNADFTKEIIKAVAEKFSAGESSDLELILPEALKADLEPFVKKEIASILGSRVEATFTKKISGGFSIAPKDGGYFISLTDETFKALISEYLRPVTKKTLFGD